MNFGFKRKRDKDGGWREIRTWVCCLAVSTLLAALACPWAARSEAPRVQDTHAAAPATPSTARTGLPYDSQQLTKLLPSSVYFEGQTANLQLRNAGAVKFGDGAISWVCLVDSSGYASDVQERYQFYLVTETRLRVGDAELPAGAYGGGFLKDRSLIWDGGAHRAGEGQCRRMPLCRDHGLCNSRRIPRRL